MLTIRTILHPTDFSKHSDDALGFAASLARDYGARLIVLHVLQRAEPPEWLEKRMAGIFPWTEYSTDAMEVRARSLRNSSPEISFETRVADGVPAREVLRVADEVGCDLIVMGTHGREGLQRALLGSVAEAIMRGARCPVLTVRNPQETASDPRPVVVEHVECSAGSVPRTRVHHRDFPEIRAECGSPAEAAEHLSGQLARARENVGSAWHRDAIDRAIADVNAFLGTLSEAGRKLASSCRCGQGEKLAPADHQDASIPSREESIPC